MIMGVSSSDDGAYHCLASNIVGTSAVHFGASFTTIIGKLSPALSSSILSIPFLFPHPNPFVTSRYFRRHGCSYSVKYCSFLWGS